MKQLTEIIVITLVATATLLAIVYATADEPVGVTEQAQPTREVYKAPEWVTNERGQRCIKQGTTITCG